MNEVKVDWKKGEARVRFDPSRVTPAALERALVAKGYKARAARVEPR